MKKYTNSSGMIIVYICLFILLIFIIQNFPKNRKVHSDSIKKYSVNIKSKYDVINKIQIYFNHGAIQFHYYLKNDDSHEIYNIFDENYKLLFYDEAIKEIDDNYTPKTYFQIFFHIPKSSDQYNTIIFQNTTQYSYYEWSVKENGTFIKTIEKGKTKSSWVKT